MNYYCITNCVENAIASVDAGINRIMIDLENNNKKTQRQKGKNAIQSHHSMSDIIKLSKVIERKYLGVRVNSLYEGGIENLKTLDFSKISFIMLPFFTTPKDIETFNDLCPNSIHKIYLFESGEAIGRAERIINKMQGEVHFGLNDLSISLNLNFLFEILTSGILDWLCALTSKNNLPYGIGGIGNLNTNQLIDPKLIATEYIRLKSNAVILSRSFFKNINSNEIKKNFNEVNSFFKSLKNESDKNIFKNSKQELINQVNKQIK